jgi:tRNA pseudouridine55 synthase
VARARGDAGLDAFVNLCKGRGPTSHDVVSSVRRLFGTRRVGHAGTLDPLAEGVLPLALGRATRLIDRLAEADKEYYAEARLGVRTTTDDAEGEILATCPLPDLDDASLDATLGELLGEIEQRPPAYSALKVGGQRAYDLARAGQDVTLQSRRVTIYRIERRRWEPPILSFTVTCSKGTYIRALARDVGERLGVGASLSRLVRTRVGPFTLDGAVSLDELRADPFGFILSPDVLVLDRPAVVLGSVEQEHLRHGRAWPAPNGAEEARAYTTDGALAGVLAAIDGRWQPRLVLVD